MLRRNLMRALFLVLVLSGLAGVIITAAQSAVAVTLREIDLSAYPQLSLPVSVVSSSGVPVMGLTTSSFEVLEDGKPLPVDNVSSQVNTDTTLAVALVLDLSNSVQLDSVKAATHLFLNVLGPNVRIAVIGFNEPLNFTEMNPVKEIGFTSDLDAVRAVVDTLPKGGASAVYEAIYKGVLLTADEIADYRAVIVLTDGYDTASRPEIAQADTPTRAAKERRIPIFTIGVYEPGMGSNPNYLNVLARETGGRYQEISDLEHLDDLFTEVVVQLQTEYLLSFRTMLSPDGKGHVLTVRVTTPESVGEGVRTFTYPLAPPIPQILKLQRVVNEQVEDLQAGASLKGKVLLVPQITAQNPLSRVEYYVDGVIAYTAFLQQSTAQKSYAPWEWRWDTTRLDAGPHRLEILAYDEMGNSSERFVIDLQTEGGGSMNPWLIIAGVAALVLLIVVLFFILRHPKSQVIATTRGYDTSGSWPPTSTVPQAPTAAAPELAALQQPEPISYAPSYEDLSAKPVRPTEPTINVRRTPEAMAWLICEKGVAPGREFRLHEVTGIGRLGSNDIVLDDPAVSRNHAKVRLEGQTFTITDLGAANPTLVNGQEIARYELQDGDRVQIGSNILVFKQIKPQ